VHPVPDPLLLRKSGTEFNFWRSPCAVTIGMEVNRAGTSRGDADRSLGGVTLVNLPPPTPQQSFPNGI
jgi:hypothetical protein